MSIENWDDLKRAIAGLPREKARDLLKRVEEMAAERGQACEWPRVGELREEVAPYGKSEAVGARGSAA